MIHLVGILVMLMVPRPSLAQEMDWYFSDGAAIRYAATTEQSGLASGFALSIQRLPGMERTIHYKDGNPVSSWLRSMDSSGQLNREAVEENGRIIEERLYGSGQQLNLERFFLSDGSVEETRYIRDGNLLTSSTRFKDGIETGSRIYLYYPDGRLAIVRDRTATEFMPTGMEKPRSGQSTSWTSTPEGLILSMYNDSGRLAKTMNYKGAVLVSTEERTWHDGRLDSLSTVRHADDTRIVLSYDEDGRLESRLESQGKEVGLFHEFFYDQDDRLILESRETLGKLEILEYVYNSDDSLLSETRMVNGLLSLSRTYSDPDEMLEDYYDKGKLFASILYKGGQKVRETIFSDGKLVRERNF